MIIFYILCIGKAFIKKSVYNKFDNVKLENMDIVLFDKKEQVLQSTNKFIKTDLSIDNLYFIEKNVLTINKISKYDCNFNNIHTKYYTYKSITSNIILKKAKAKNM